MAVLLPTAFGQMLGCLMWADSLVWLISVAVTGNLPLFFSPGRKVGSQMKCKLFLVLLEGSRVSVSGPWKSYFVPGPYLI